MPHQTEFKTHQFKIKQGDTGPDLTTVLLGSTGLPVDLTNATEVTLSMQLAKHPRTLVLDDVPVSFVPDATGAVTYEWQTGDTDDVGTYDIEWRVTWAGSPPFVMTFPTEGFDKVIIGREI